jgi:DNA polymerase/3'-5' exonuclease PolX
MSKGPKIPHNKAMEVARRFLDLIKPFVEKAEIAGSIRRGCSEVGDVEIVCVENQLNGLDNLFYDGYPGLVVNGPRLKRFKYPKSNIQIELYIAQPHDYGRIFAIRTGSSAYSHIKLAITWNRRGWCGTSEGLRLKRECEKKGSQWKVKAPYNKMGCTKPPPFNTEADFFEFLGIPWIPPSQRNWTSKHGQLNYSQ